MLAETSAVSQYGPWARHRRRKEHEDKAYARLLAERHQEVRRLDRSLASLREQARYELEQVTQVQSMPRLPAKRSQELGRRLEKLLAMPSAPPKALGAREAKAKRKADDSVMREGVKKKGKR